MSPRRFRYCSLPALWRPERGSNRFIHSAHTNIRSHSICVDVRLGSDFAALTARTPGPASTDAGALSASQHSLRKVKSKRLLAWGPAGRARRRCPVRGLEVMHLELGRKPLQRPAIHETRAGGRQARTLTRGQVQPEQQGARSGDEQDEEETDAAHRVVMSLYPNPVRMASSAFCS